MNFTVLLPHYKSGELTELAIRKMLKHQGKHEIDIIVINNSAGDGSEKPFLHHVAYRDNVRMFEYPKHMLQSHGIAFDWVMHMVKTEYFITVESDSFPTSDDWLDAYEYSIRFKKAVAGGAVIQLPKGFYLHPCGAFYKTSVYREALEYCKSQPYVYYPNLWNDGKHSYHVMVHKSINDTFMRLPHTFIPTDDLQYCPPYMSMEDKIKKFNQQAAYYKPSTLPFHNGMGFANESVHNYRERNFQTDALNTLINETRSYDTKLIKRVGYEPGQWFSYWMVANGYYIDAYPIELRWLPNRENQQQEYTLMSNGFKHLWAGSAYLDMKDTELNDVYEFKKNQIEEECRKD